MGVRQDGGREERAVERKVVTAFLVRDGKVLLLRRSQRVRSYQGRWAGVSGSIPEGTEPLEQALTEIEEETGIPRDRVRPVRTGTPLPVEDAALGVTWVVHPFLFRVDAPLEPRLDWEHDEARWVAPETMARLETVPALEEAWRSVTG